MAKQGSDSSSLELSHYVAVLRRRWKYVAACFVLGVVLAGTVVALVPTRSTSTTLLNVDVIAANAFSTSRPASDLIDGPTEQAMVRSTRVMTEIADELGDGWTKASVRTNTEATMLPDGTVLRIEFTASSAEVAARGAALIAETYLARRTEAAEERLESASDRLVERRETLAEQLAQVTRAAADAEAGEAERLAAEMERQRVSEELSSVTGQLSELEAINTSGGQVVTEADPAQVVVSPNRPLLLLSGALGGLLLGLVVAFFVNVLDRRVRDAYDVVGAGGRTVLARLTGGYAELPASGHDVDQVRALRERLMSAVEARRPVLAVVEVAPTDVSPSDLAANLAVSLSDSGLTTELVLADYPPAALAAVVEALGVREITPVGHARRFRGGVSETLTVVVPDGRGTRLATSDLLAELVADDVRVAECTVVGVAPGAGDAVRLTAGRCAHESVLGVHESVTTIDGLAAAGSGLQSVRAVVLGTVLVPGGRELGADTGPAPVSDAVTDPAPDTEQVTAQDESDDGAVAPPGGPAEEAGERARSLDRASRKGRLRAGNTAVTAPEDQLDPEPELELVDEPRMEPVIEPHPEPHPGPHPELTTESTAQSKNDEDPVHEEPELVRDDPPPPRESGTLPWAFSR